MLEKQNECVCTKLCYRLMQISLNVDVHECQESLNQQQLGSKPSLSGLNFVQYNIKDLTSLDYLVC